MRGCAGTAGAAIARSQKSGQCWWVGAWHQGRCPHDRQRSSAIVVPKLRSVSNGKGGGEHRSGHNCPHSINPAVDRQDRWGTTRKLTVGSPVLQSCQELAQLLTRELHLQGRRALGPADRVKGGSRNGLTEKHEVAEQQCPRHGDDRGLQRCKQHRDGCSRSRALPHPDGLRTRLFDRLA